MVSSDVRTSTIFSTGQYCIYKKGSCPDGLNDGFVYWDDDDNEKKTRIVKVGHFQMVSTTGIQKSSFVVGLMQTKTSL